MPKIREAVVSHDTLRVMCTVFYIPPAGYKSGFFFIMPKDESYILPQHSLLTNQRIGKNYKSGVGADTEQKALEAFKDYLKDYKEQALHRVPLLFIKIHYSLPNRSDFNSNDHQVDASINFEYLVGYKMVIEGKDKYFKDKVYHDRSCDSEIYYIDKYTVVPFTKEALQRCEEIIQEFNGLNKKLHDLFNDPGNAERILLKGSSLFLEY